MNRVWPAVPASLSEIRQWVYDLALEAGFPEPEARRWMVAVEEVAANIVLYAYPEGEGGEITVEVRPFSSRLTIQFSDQGKPFNPLALPEPDLKAGLADRKIGGLGIYLTRNMVDRLEYERRDEKNILTLSQPLPFGRIREAGSNDPEGSGF